MGSQPSVVEVRKDKKGGFQVVSRDGKPVAAGGKNKKGFKEVELVNADGSKVTSTSKSKGGGGKGKKDYQDKANELMSEDPLSSNQPQQTGENGQPTYGDDDELVMETFYHSSGAVYCCVYQGGQRFYLDSWQTQDWQPFPHSWYKEGVLVTDRIMKNEEMAGAEGASVSNAFQQMSDDREGYVDHPEKGRLATYIFEEKRNVHYFFDQDSGNWIRLPISWELNSELIQKLLDPIQESLPEWSDRHDVLASLRAANYDPHDAIATYLAVSDKGHIAMPKNAEDVKMMQEKDAKIKDLEDKCKKLKKKLEKTNKSLEDQKKEKQSAEASVQELQERVGTLEADVSSASAQLSAVKRPKSARSRAGGSSDVSSDTVRELHQNAKALHIEYSQLKMETAKKFEELQYIMKQMAVATMRLKMFDSDQTSELDELRELYRRETLQRKLLYNQLQEIKGNIRVFCRCRRDDSIPNCLEFPNDQEVRAPGSKRMKFDKVFTPIATQEEVFEEVKPIIGSCVDGYNVCTLAYGQTGSGKTYTMMGPQSDPGVNVRAVMELLKICQERDNIDYTLKASMVEIYNETIQDILSDTVETLDLRMQGKKMYLPGITEMFVETMDDIRTIMALGDKNRSTAATKMNSSSSRSHLIFMITVEGRDKASGATSEGTLTLCDLAGSERVSKTEAQGKRLIEAAAINKSLTSLGQVFTALRTGQLHIPYRNSKLTHLLQASLGGDAKACLFVMVSPDEYNKAETISTLTFGSNARQVALGQAKKNAILFTNVRTDEDNLSETISTLSFGDAARNVSADETKRKKKKRHAAAPAPAAFSGPGDDDMEASGRGGGGGGGGVDTGDGGWMEDF